MTNIPKSGVRLEFPDDRAPLTDLPEINKALFAVGAQLWPLDLGAAPEEVRNLLAEPSLSDAESARIKEQFLMPRDRLLDLISGAGREPQAPGGGELVTLCLPHDYTYPQLYSVEAGIDYSRFDRLHVNTTDDGTGVDEFMQILSGGGVVVHQELAPGSLLTTHLSCPGDNSGWIMTYDGGVPHVGSLTGARAGTKVLMQIIGAPRWVMRYNDET